MAVRDVAIPNRTVFDFSVLTVAVVTVALLTVTVLSVAVPTVSADVAVHVAVLTVAVPTVSADVAVHVAVGGEAGVAEGAAEGSLAGVGEQVSLQRAVAAQASGAQATGVQATLRRLQRAAVAPDVLCERLFVLEVSLAARAALQPGLTRFLGKSWLLLELIYNF